jgi:hypothetical protein
MRNLLYYRELGGREYEVPVFYRFLKYEEAGTPS